MICYFLYGILWINVKIISSIVGNNNNNLIYYELIIINKINYLLLTVLYDSKVMGSIPRNAWTHKKINYTLNALIVNLIAHFD